MSRGTSRRRGGRRAGIQMEARRLMRILLGSVGLRSTGPMRIGQRTLRGTAFAAVWGLLGCGDESSAGTETAGNSSTTAVETTSGEPATTTPVPTTSTSPTTGGDSSQDSATTSGEPTTGGSTSGAEPVCGDGELDAGEACDEGEGNGPGQACKSDCTSNTCGDGD